MNTNQVRKDILVSGALLLAALIVSIAGFAAFASVHGSNVDAAAPPKPACATDHITVWIDEPTPCDVQPGQRLSVAGLPSVTDTPWTLCDDQGGRWIGDGVDLCIEVDF